MKKLFYGAAVAIFAIVSCSREIQDPNVENLGSGKVHSLSVGIEAGEYQTEDETKASMKAVVRVEWKNGDKVSVVNATQGKLLGGYLEADTEDANGYIATFSGTVIGPIDEGDQLYYIYPALENAPSSEVDFGEYGISLQNQNYDAENTGNVCFYGYASDVAGSSDYISKKIQFTLVTAYVHLNMSNLPAAGAALTSIDLSNVNGGFKWVMDNNGCLSAKPYLENQGISVACTNTKISKSGNAIVRFAVPESPEIKDPNISRVLTVNKAYTNSGYSKTARKAAAYYNQLYSSWQSNVTVDDKGTEVKVTVDNGGSTESAEGVLPVAEAFKSDKPASISMGGVGTITFDQTATAQILNNTQDAGSTNVFFKVEDVTETKPVQNANIVYEVTMKTVDEKGVEVFSTDKAAGVATVVVPLDDNVESVQSVSLVKEDGTPIEGGVVEESVKFEKPNLTFQVNHFSKYAIKYTLSETQIDPVALIGERKYATLESAVAAVQHGQTITLIKDVELSEPIVTDKTFTLTLEKNITPVSTWGETYNNTRDALIIVKRGGDITINGTGEISSNHKNVWAAVKLTQTGEPETGDAAKLTVDGDVTLQGYYYGIVGNGNRHNTEITVNGGTIKSCAEEEGLGIYHPQNGTLTITDGEITGYESAVELRGGSINVSGGTLTSTATSFSCKPDGSGTTTVGAALAIAQHTTKVDLGVTITGGTFIGAKALNESNPQDNDPAPQVTMSVSDGKFKGEVSTVDVKNFISGGLFSTKPAADLIVAGKAAIDNTDESTNATYPWTIGERPNVAKIGTTEYATLAEAFAAVPADAAEPTIITIINNANETFDSRGAQLNKGQKVVLDLNGNTLVGTSTKSGYTQYIYVENGAELTVKDSRTGGAIEYHDAYIENLASGSGTGGSAITCHGCMTLESGTIENKTPDTKTDDLEGAIDMYTNAWGQAYSPADIVLNINGGVVKSNNANTVRLTSFSAQSYTTSVTVNMNGGEVYGRDGFFIHGVSESYLNTNTLNLKGGKVCGTQAVRVMAFQNHANASEEKPVTIKICEGVELTNNYFTQSTKTGWSEDICIDNLSGSFEQLLSYVNIIVEGGVAKIDHTTYRSLAEAVEAASQLAQIHLIADCAEEVTVAKNVELFTDGFEFTGKLTPATGFYTFDKDDISNLGDFSSFYPTEMDYITLAYPSAEVHNIDCSGESPVIFDQKELETAYSFNAFDTKITREDTDMTDMDLMNMVLGDPDFSKLNNFDFDAFGQAFDGLTEQQKKRVNEIISTMLPYLSWIADFEVHFNKDVAEESLGVSGYYGSYANAEGNGFGMDIDAPKDFTVGDTYRMLYEFAGMEIPYAGICLAVRTFECGAYRLNNDVSGTEMTVDLCLYKPGNSEGKIVVGTYSYTFPEISE